MDELKRFKKKHKLTKKEKERVEMWVESGHSAYDTRWWDELEQEEELDELLSGLTDVNRLDDLDLKNLPTFEEEEEPEIDLPF